MAEHTVRGDVTGLLNAVRHGDRQAEAEILPLIYRELHQIASRYMRRERPEHTLQATALVNEAYLRLIDQKKADWQSRTHFLAIAAQTMRRILIDHARSRACTKRAGNVVKLSLDEALTCSDEACSALVELDDALKRLTGIAPRASNVVELLFFGGLSIDEAADALGVARRTVNRDWQFARAWLHSALTR